MSQTAQGERWEWAAKQSGTEVKIHEGGDDVQLAPPPDLGTNKVLGFSHPCSALRRGLGKSR